MNDRPADVRNPGGRTGDEVRRMFAGIARRYDLANTILSFGLDARWRRRAAMEAAGLPPGPIVDVCSGTGAMAFELDRTRGTEAKGMRRAIVGVDFCAEMLTEAAARSARRGNGASTLFFVRADALRLPLADGSAAAAFAAFGIRNVPDAAACLREMARVVARGGKVVVLEFSMPRGRFLGALYGIYSRAVLPTLGRLITRTRDDAYSYLQRSVRAFSCSGDLALLMRDAGLADVSVEPLAGGIVSLYVGRKA